MNRPSTIALALLLIPVAAPLASAGDEPAPPAEFSMQVGDQRLMTVSEIKRVSVSNPQVADVKPKGGDSFMLFAVGTGTCTVTVDRDGKPRVTILVKVTDDLVRKTIVLRYADGRSVEQLLRPYLTKRGRVHYEHNTRALTMVDEQAVIDIMLKMIERFDVKPRQIQFVLRLVEADKADAPGPVPAEIRSVVKQIQEVLRYNQFKVVDQAFLAIEANRESKLQVGGQNGYTVELSTQMEEGRSDSVRLKFHLYRKEKVDSREKGPIFVRHTLVATTVEMTDGETAVLGASKINGNGKALITVVSMKLKK